MINAASRVSIVGGSIAGCAAAIAFRQLGATVKVFERSEHALTDRGAGIAFPMDLLKPLITNDFLDEAAEHFTCETRHMITKSNANSFFGKTLWESPFSATTMNWGTLFSQLRNRIPNGIYHAGYEVVQASQTADGVTLKFANCKQHQSDVVVFADGYDSFGRKLLFPKLNPVDCRYVVWRGLLEASQLEDVTPFMNTANYYLYEGGHALCYMIPSNSAGKTLNWLLYEDLSKTNRQYPNSIPPGQLSDEQLTHLYSLVDQHFPEVVSKVARLTPKPFLQSVFELDLPYVSKGRIALTGDADSILRPHVAAGATKALQNALLISEIFSDPSLSLEEALQRWGEAVHKNNSQYSDVSKLIGRAMVTDVPDWFSMSEADMKNWWDSVMAGKSWYITPKV